MRDPAACSTMRGRWAAHFARAADASDPYASSHVLVRGSSDPIILPFARHRSLDSLNASSGGASKVVGSMNCSENTLLKVLYRFKKKKKKNLQFLD